MNVSTVASRSERPTADDPPGGDIDDEKPIAVLGTDEEIELVLRGEPPISVDIAKREKRRRRILEWINGGLQGGPGLVVPVEFHAIRRERPVQSDVHNDERAGTPGYDLEGNSGHRRLLFMLKGDWQEHDRERGEEDQPRGERCGKEAPRGGGRRPSPPKFGIAPAQPGNLHGLTPRKSRAAMASPCGRAPSGRTRPSPRRQGP